MVNYYKFFFECISSAKTYYEYLCNPLDHIHSSVCFRSFLLKEICYSNIVLNVLSRIDVLNQLEIVVETSV